MPLFETIPYEVVYKTKRIEIRSYENILLAQTTSHMNQRLDSGFMNVFNYISGENDQTKKISMTTPVVTYENDDALVTGFYVPKKYSKDNVPKPTSYKVDIHEIPKSLYAVIRFRGTWKASIFNEKEKVLLDFIKNNGYQVISSRYLFRYQPPFIPSFFRRNEIAFKIIDNK